MNKSRVLLMAALLLVAAVPRASLVTTMKVTTTSDDDGGDPTTCSLREAVKAVSSGAPYGGCPAPGAFTDNLVQLEAGQTYTLTRGELRVDQDIIITGQDAQKAAHDLQLNPLTGLAPRKVRPDFQDTVNGKTGTYIVAADNSRIFDSTANMTLRDLVLVGSDSASRPTRTAVAGNGGVIFAAASVQMENVILGGGHASGGTVAAGNGGAIYLAGDGTNLTLTDVTLLNNRADNKGGAVAMLCKVGLSASSAHSVTLTRSLLRGNAGTLGAGAIEFCGDTNATLTASTLSGNSSAASSGALAYVQGSAVGIGTLTLDQVTAAEQLGHVIAGNGLANVQINGSLLSAFDTVPRADICFNPNPTVAWSKITPASGANNAIDNDSSCADIVSATAPGVSIPLGTPLSSQLVPIPAYGSYYPATPAGGPVGLTDYYLPRMGSLLVDKAETFDNCRTNDQRNSERRSGDKCDIGAVERLQATARDDSANNKLETDRMAVVDVLANDSFGEGDVDGPYKFAPNTADDPATPVDESKPAVVFAPGGNPDGLCKWVLNGDGENAGKMEVHSDKGALTPEGSPIVCKYQVVDTQPSTSTTVATVSVTIRNAPPRANPDTYVRPVGTREISFDPMTNDDDAGDGKYGLVKHTDPVTSVVTWGPETAWAPFYPIEIETQPQLGTVVGSSSGVCPGSSAVPRRCLNPPLRYIADNNMSPFEDTFSYRVYDIDGAASSPATVTINTDAPDVDHGGGAGSLDVLGGLLLGLLGLRRFRRL